jgi:hypothetical protein
MTLYAANPNTVTSPPIIVVLCSLIFVFSMADVLADVVFGPDQETK